ncbi:hypothetical protein BKA63DRAFT_507618 [Paraphoma chrysanthemicola]|nr:hypothetical protein BKA63DRAFT_507618 [Paraphoma chrysanthemicola]
MIMDRARKALPTLEIQVIPLLQIRRGNFSPAGARLWRHLAVRQQLASILPSSNRENRGETEKTTSRNASMVPQLTMCSPHGKHRPKVRLCRIDRSARLDRREGFRPQTFHDPRFCNPTHPARRSASIIIILHQHHRAIITILLIGQHRRRSFTAILSPMLKSRISGCASRNLIYWVALNSLLHAPIKWVDLGCQGCLTTMVQLRQQRCQTSQRR